MTHLDALRVYLTACGCRECQRLLQEAYEFMGALRREHADGLLDPTLPMIERGQWEVLS
jgi:hypothetical protein